MIDADSVRWFYSSAFSNVESSRLKRRSFCVAHARCGKLLAHIMQTCQQVSQNFRESPEMEHNDLQVSRKCYKISRNLGNLINLIFFFKKTCFWTFGVNPRGFVFIYFLFIMSYLPRSTPSVRCSPWGSCITCMTKQTSIICVNPRNADYRTWN